MNALRHVMMFVFEVDNTEEKESIRAKEKDPDKDEDLVADPPFDLDSCRRAFDHLKKVYFLFTYYSVHTHSI